MHFLMFAAGLAALVVGADILVRGASRLALSFGISPLVVGLTIVAFGTSAPEVAVSVGAVLNGQTGLAMGNVVGSNIFNVLFILGLSAIIAPLVVHVQLIRQEIPIMIGASVLILLLSLDGTLSLLDGALLFGLLIVYTVFLVLQSRRETRQAQAEYDAEIQPAASTAWDARLPVQIALANPHLTGGGYDLPVVKPIFDDYVASFGLSPRLKFQAGNFFTDALPKADVLLMGHILHDWDLKDKRMLLKQAFDALPSGGAIVVFEAIIDDDRRENAFGLLMSLNMLIETPGGFDYTGADCRTWMQEAGFRDTYVEHLAGPDSMVVGFKP